MGFGPTGSDLSFTGGVSTAWDGREGQYSYGHSVGTGLTYNANDTWDLSFQQSVGVSDITQAGFHGIGTGVGTTFNFGDGHVTASQGITTDFEIQSLEKAALGIHTLKAELELEAANPNTSPERLEQIRDELRDLDKQLGNVTAWEEQRLAKIDELLEDGKLTPEQAEKLRENPELAHEEGPIRDALIDAGFIGGSREGWLSELLGGIGDELAFLFGGDASNVNGWIDENGEFQFRTCFVAGTLVQVHPETAGAFKRNAESYKLIENIEAGDRVLSFDEVAGKTLYAPVTKTYAREADQIYRILYSNGVEVKTTWNHPFYIVGAGWVKAEKLREGQLSLLGSGASLEIVRITIEPGRATVYNFEVAGSHTYFVSDSSILVHNYANWIWTAGVNALVALGLIRAGTACVMWCTADDKPPELISGDPEDGRPGDGSVPDSGEEVKPPPARYSDESQEERNERDRQGDNYTEDPERRGEEFRKPASRHSLDRVNQRTVAKDKNTVIESWVDVDADVAEINAGNGILLNDHFIINGRIYGIKPNGTLFPVAGDGFHFLNRAQFKALGVLNQLGDTPYSRDILDRMKIPLEDINRAREVWKLAKK